MPRSSEIDTAQQFAHENQIHAAHDLRTNVGTFRQRIKHINRAQVGVVPEQSPQIEQAALRLFGGGKAVVLRIANGAEQNRLRILAEFNGRRRQRRIVAIDGDAADGSFDDVERAVEQAAAEFKNTARFGENFGADAVTGKKSDLTISCRSCGSARRGPASRRADDFLQILVIHLLLPICDCGHQHVGVFQFLGTQRLSHRAAAGHERVTPGMLSENDLAFGHADRSRRHDFVGNGVLQHAVLMDAGFVRERVVADDGLVGLNRHAGDFAQQAAGGVEFLGR